MPLYNFKKQFSDRIRQGIKRQTIRPKRKRPTKPGEILYLYTGLRTQHTQKLGEFRCTSVEEILVSTSAEIFIGQRRLTPDEIQDLASKDGFNSTQEFISFFEQIYGLPWEGQLIQWEHSPIQPGI